MCFIVTCRCDCEVDVCDALLEILTRLSGELPRLSIHLHTTEIVLSDQCVLDIGLITRLLKINMKLYTINHPIDYYRRRLLSFHDETNWSHTSKFGLASGTPYHHMV